MSTNHQIRRVLRYARASAFAVQQRKLKKSKRSTTAGLRGTAVLRQRQKKTSDE